MVAATGPVLWHVSENPRIARFEPRSVEVHDSQEPLVWAIDDAHVPAYWFPRDVPRGTWWATAETTGADVERFLGGERARRVHAIQREWLDDFRAGRVYAYRLPPATFEPYDENAGYYVSRAPVEPLEAIELTDLEGKHRDAGIDLRIVDDLKALWDEVIASTVAFSGIRLKKLADRRT
jgi:hypothetical protein